jgi:methyl acetate hydrolase
MAMNRLVPRLVLAAVLATTATAASVRWSNAQRAALDEFLRASVAQGDPPAVVAMVVDQRSTLYLGAFGKQNVAEHRGVTPDTIFRIASMTKPVTSLAVMMLYDEGKLAFDDPVTMYLPEFANVRVMTTWNEANATYESRPPTRMITVGQLLTHTSGIGYAFADARLHKLDTANKTEADLPLLHEPGETFTYGPSTAVLGRIVEKVSGQPLDLFLKTRIFDPLGMSDTSYVVPAEKRDRVITVHARDAAGTLTERPNAAAPRSPVRGDGGLFSTAADYAKFMQLFLNGGRHGATALIAPRTLRLMTSNQIGALTVVEQPSADPALARPFPIGSGKDTFGFGFQIEAAPAVRGLRTAGSLSWGGIDNTHFWIDREQSIAAVVLMQVLPYYDSRALDVLRGVEQRVYARLRT